MSLISPRARLEVVEPAPKPLTQLQRTRAFARIMAEHDKAQAALAIAKAKMAAAFPDYANGRRITLEQARTELEATGYLAPRKPAE